MSCKTAKDQKVSAISSHESKGVITDNSERSNPKAVHIDRYRVLKGIASGATSDVYLANDPKMNRRVALKVLSRELSKNAKAQLRFKHEAHALASLKHPNIIRIFDNGMISDDFHFLVMEYVEGAHVGKFIRQHGPMPEMVLLALAMELADALRYAHTTGIIHRDLKPENVFLDKDRIVLGDFGIAKQLDDAHAPENTEILGTPGFMAPEQLNDDALTARTDIFSFGALLYYLATKELAYHAPSPYALARRFEGPAACSVRKLRPDLSTRFAHLIADCIEIRPSLRPPNMGSVWRRLKKIFESHGLTQPRDILAGYYHSPEQYVGRSSERSKTIPRTLWGPWHAIKRSAFPLAASMSIAMLWFLGAKPFKELGSSSSSPVAMQARP